MSLRQLDNSQVYCKSRRLAVAIYKLCVWVQKEQKEYNYTNQLIRSSASVCANIAEGLNGESNADFIHKLKTSLKECSESYTWLTILRDTENITEQCCENYVDECEEVYKMLTAIVRTASQKH